MLKLTVFASLLVASSIVVADQHILLDTTKESMLDWTRYPYGPQSPTPGWVEESFTNFEKGINWRSYVVCDVGYKNVNNWLWTPFITRHDANRIYIEIKFSLRNCDLFPGTALQCKETFSLLYYEFDAATREPPPWQPESYKQIDVIAADEGRFTNNNEVIINTETRSIDVTKKGVYFAFRDQGACLSLLAVKVYYLKCPDITVGFAKYPETATGAELTSIEKIPGRCVENSVAVQDPHNLCKADGTWSFHTGTCSCMAGYDADDAETVCKACTVGRYKNSVGETSCEICPAHSQALFGGSVECRCNDGFYRASADSKAESCTRPPSAPQNLHFRFLDDTRIRLFWDPPLDEGARSDTRYSVTCPGCPSRPTLPVDAMSQQTSVVASNLQEGLTYTFVVTAHNGVSNLSTSATDMSRSSEITVATESSDGASVVSNVLVVDVKPTLVKLSWQPPSDPLLDIEVYEVKYFERGTNASQIVITKKDVVEIKNLKENTEYAFQVRAQTSNGWGDFSRAEFKVTGLVSDPVFVGDNQSTQIKVAVGVIVTILIILALVATVFFVFKRTVGERRLHEKSADSLDYRGIENTFPGTSETLPIVQTMGSSLAHPPIYNPFSSHKTYVDPHTYEDPHVAVKQFAKEIDSKYITIEAIIGGGEFGDVCRGRLSVPDRNDMLVAIKTLKPGSSDKAKVDFLTEASIMGQFEHPNVIFLQGVVTKVLTSLFLTDSRMFANCLFDFRPTPS